MSHEKQEKVWIVQRCIDAWTNYYEDWPGYYEQPMTRDDIMDALVQCEEKWPEYSFRGHNITHPVIRNIRGAFPCVKKSNPSR